MSGPLDALRALVDAAVEAAMDLELPPNEVAHVAALLPSPVFAMAWLLITQDPELRQRWNAAGDDWVARGGVLREAVLFVVTPAAAPPHGPVQ